MHELGTGRTVIQAISMVYSKSLSEQHEVLMCFYGLLHHHGQALAFQCSIYAVQAVALTSFCTNATKINVC